MIFTVLGIRSCVLHYFALCSFAQNPSNNWATVNDSLSSLFNKEQLWANRSRCSTLSYSFLQSDGIESFLSLFAQSLFASRSFLQICSRCSWQKSGGKQITTFTPYKRARVSEWLLWLLTKERLWVIFSFSQLNTSFALLLTKNKRFAQKTNEQIPNAGFLTLLGGTITLPGPNENGFVNFLFWQRD